MMKYIVLTIILSLIGVGYFIFNNNVEIPSLNSDSRTVNNSNKTDTDSPEVTIIAEGLDTPWSIIFLPDESILVTERQGTVRRITADGNLEQNPIFTIENAQEIGEGGLLGMTLHPKFVSNNFIYFYYTYQNNGGNTLNRVVRMTYKNNTLENEEIIVDAIPGASNHNGGEIQFGPDNYLYITTGDAQEPSQAQDTNSIAGKILRVTEDGDLVPENTLKNSVYSYGHRNSQGIAWDGNGNLWSTEHGRSGVFSGFDEVNLIQAGNNYGWPTIEGDETQEGMIPPIIHSGASDTWAPGSIAIIENEIYFTGLRGRALYKGSIRNNQIDQVTNYYKEEFGRIREVIVGPDNMLYISTSNRDGRGTPESTDDRIMRINPSKL